MKSSQSNVTGYIFKSSIKSNKYACFLLSSVFICVILSCVFESLANYYYRSFYEYIKIEDKTNEILTKQLINYFLFYFLHCFFGWFHDHLYFSNLHYINSKIYSNLIKLYLQIDYENYHTLGSGKISSYIHKQASSFTNLFELIFIKLIYSVVYLILFFKQLYYNKIYENSVKCMFLLFFILSMSYISICSYYSGLKRSRFLKAEHSSNNLILDILRNYNIIKSFNSEKKELSKFDRSMASYIYFGKSLNTFIKLSGLIFRLIAFIIIAICTSKNYMLSKNSFNIEVIFLTKMMVDDVKDIRAKLNSIRDCSMKISSKLMNIKNEEINVVKREKNLIKFNEKSILIEYKNVGIFVENTVILKNINIDIKYGDKIAITGDNGSGKSTIIKTLLGFNDYTGKILFNGIDINQIDVESLRNIISYVPQEPYLFNISVIDNLKYGSNISDEEIFKICQQYQIHSIFKNLKNGYDTIVGENNKYISGGQAQMINFMRGVIKNAPIILLDEPTSNLDYHTSNLILDKIFTDLKNKTVFYTTHNPFHLSKFDKIISVSKGNYKIYNNYIQYEMENMSFVNEYFKY